MILLFEPVAFWMSFGAVALLGITVLISYFAGDIGNYQSPAERREEAEKKAEEEQRWALREEESKAYDGNRKYILLKDDTYGELYRIQAVRDFADVEEGDLGGYIEREANLSHEGDCWVYWDRDYSNYRHFGLVKQDAKVSGNARIHPDARIFGNAEVYDDAQVFASQVYGNAVVCGKAIVYADSEIYADAEVSGNTTIGNNVKIFGQAKVRNATVRNGSTIYGNAEVFDTIVGEHEIVRGND